MKKFISEFKEFISKGNVLDMAVGVIIGGAFSKIVSSLVNDVMMPLIGIIIGGHDFTNLSIKVGNAKIMYGSFLQNVVDFLIVAFCLFTVIKIINRFKKKQEKNENKEKIKTPSEEVILLSEIRDLLKTDKTTKKKVTKK
ncbi:large-conductance mechanosensitive channel [Clostridium sp. CAG:628]|jgi:large conductance mechanosensitive channel|nr:large-conductance mechanosensitive channel [Clostridium sp. CAG:628]